MAATTATALRSPSETDRSTSFPSWSVPWTLVLPLLTAIAVAIDGFHPLAEDGGLYVAGIEYRLNQSLFPHYTVFVTEHLRFSVFAPVVAAGIRLTHLPLLLAVFFGYAFSLWLTLYAGLLILRRCTPSEASQLGGVALLAMWSTLPVAGTSLLLVDPYFTARSLSTPLSLISIAFALDAWSCKKGSGLRSLAICALSLACGALMHPLMAAYAFAIIALLRVLRSRNAYPLCAALSVAALLIATILHWLAPKDPPAVVAASLSRYYWFLSQWRWYELFGLLGPVIVLLLLLRGLATPARSLTKAALIAGATASLIAFCFAHEKSTTYLVARIQPLRVFLLIYAVMTLLLGAQLCHWSAKLALKSGRWLLRMTALTTPVAIFAVSGIALFNAQRATFPASQHIEWPLSQPLNSWSRAFIWARDNTPYDALFALDADYITTDGEDAQSFRATSLRSSVPDFSKDGGEASITPSLAPLWQRSLAAQFAIQEGTQLTGKATLSREPDAERDGHLRPLGVTWVLLHADAVTAHSCPYINEVVKVCRLE